MRGKSVVLGLVVVAQWLLAASVFADDGLFPSFPSIEPNVAFWEKVYSTYSLTQGIIHDKDDLSKVYEVVDLLPADEPGARRVNQERVREAKRRYREILLRLADGEQAAGPEEQRVFELFGPNVALSQLTAAADNIRFQLGQKDRFRQGVVRSGAYLEQVKQIFRSYGLSEELAYLAHVESSYNYKAYSKLGAAGIWQFTRSTGKLYMTVDYSVDERRDPILSTHAAAKLLQRNFEKLGSWPLAITAYNHGATGMERAKELHGGYENIFNNYEGRAFKFASRNFYSEFLAARKVAGNHEAYFGNLRLDEPVESCAVRVDGYAAITDLARHFQVDVATLEKFNPALRPPVFLGQKHVPRGCILRLPAGTVPGGENALLAAVIPEELYRQEQKHSNFYQVQRGDTAWNIARRHRITLQDLILANNLDGRGTVFVGQNLRIPASDERPILLAASSKKRVVPAAERIEVVGLEPELDEPETLAAVEDEEGHVPVARRPARDSSGEPGYMQASMVPFASLGDRLLSDLVAGWLAPAERSMDELVIPHRADYLAATNPAVVSGNLAVTKVYEARGGKRGLVTVEADETVGHFADWLGVPASEIRKLNGIRYGSGIRLSQSLVIPLDRVSKEEFEERRYEYHKEMEEDFWQAYRVAGLRPHRIRRGENIWTLCEAQFELPFWLVKKYNTSIDFGKLMPEQTIMVPVVEKIG